MSGSGGVRDLATHEVDDALNFGAARTAAGSGPCLLAHGSKTAGTVQDRFDDGCFGHGVAVADARRVRDGFNRSGWGIAGWREQQLGTLRRCG